jgi:hypothetical protein
MARQPLSPQEFVEDFDVHVSDVDLAHDIVGYLDAAQAPGVVAAAKQLLQAVEDFDAALAHAGIRDAVYDLTSKV